jgi:hypothetical protein
VTVVEAGAVEAGADVAVGAVPAVDAWEVSAVVDVPPDSSALTLALVWASVPEVVPVLRSAEGAVVACVVAPVSAVGAVELVVAPVVVPVCEVVSAGAVAPVVAAGAVAAVCPVVVPVSAVGAVAGVPVPVACVVALGVPVVVGAVTCAVVPTVDVAPCAAVPVVDPVPMVVECELDVVPRSAVGALPWDVTVVPPVAEPCVVAVAAVDGWAAVAEFPAVVAEDLVAAPAPRSAAGAVACDCVVPVSEKVLAAAPVVGVAVACLTVLEIGCAAAFVCTAADTGVATTALPRAAPEVAATVCPT